MEHCTKPDKGRLVTSHKVIKIKEIEGGDGYWWKISQTCGTIHKFKKHKLNLTRYISDI